MKAGTAIANNSATDEESAASSEELSGQAEMLKEMVNRFKLRKKNENKQLEVRESFELNKKIDLSNNITDKY